MRIVLPSEVEARSADIGPKTRNLRRMEAAGLPVPAFVAIPRGAVSSIQKDTSILASLSQEIIEVLPAKQYAVRSAAIAEDTKHESFAGQFTTEIKVEPSRLAEAIRSVVADAAAKGHGDAFSVLVQEYVPATHAGVAFTRSPDGERHMTIEYHRGIGEGIVSGTVKPSIIKTHWTDAAPRSSLKNLERGIELFKTIERLFGFAQDIEWCIDASGSWHILQARPLTTINDAQYAACLSLDEALPKQTAFLYEKTEVSEIAPRPTPVTLDLLERIYGPGGPAERAYAAFGVRYHAERFLRIIGNELYVDREKELKTLLPSFSRFGSKDMSPRFAALTGTMATLRNSGALTKIDPARERPHVVSMLRDALSANLAANSVREALEKFLDGYATVVRVNILAGKALAALERSLGGSGAAAAALASVSVETGITLPDTSGLRGNALELADETPFYRSPKSKNGPATPANSAVLETAAFYADARECGRLLTVKLATMLRSEVVRRAKELSIQEGDSYFCTFGELMDGTATPGLAARRKSDHERYASFEFPARLAHSFVEESTGMRGVSAGIAEGTLVTPEQLKDTPGKKILVTASLAPSLTSCFDEIDGIVAEHGGLLSHLAIVARERGLPVVVGFTPGATATIGDDVRIDGSAGIVERTPKRGS